MTAASERDTPFVIEAYARSISSAVLFIDGDGNWKGAATNVTLKWKNKKFDAVFKGSYETRQVILKNKTNWVGKTVKFLYMGLTGLGTPNYARIDPSNCFHSDK